MNGKIAQPKFKLTGFGEIFKDSLTRTEYSMIYFAIFTTS